MSSDASRVRVVIPTDRWPVEVLRLIHEPALDRAVAFVKGTSLALINEHYRAFVAKGTGVVERFYGHKGYRLDLSDTIDTGSSWQLGVLLAHALHAAGHLAQDGEAADTLLWATGAVSAIDLSIHRVDKMQEKLELLLNDPPKVNRLIVAWPRENVRDVSADLRQRLARLTKHVHELDSVHSALAMLKLSPVRAGAADRPGRR
jgi:hypothetical protein